MCRSLRLIATAAIVLALVGCDRSPTTCSVKRKVVFKGSGQPLSRGTVVFESVAEPKVLASGEIAAALGQVFQEGRESSVGGD